MTLHIALQKRLDLEQPIGAELGVQFRRDRGTGAALSDNFLELLFDVESLFRVLPCLVPVDVRCRSSSGTCKRNEQQLFDEKEGNNIPMTSKIYSAGLAVGGQAYPPLFSK